MRLDRRKLRTLLPHAGAMCLLDEILEWDETRIVASSGSHRLPDNPLRRGGCLSAVCGIEYAAQAAAIHGSLLTGERDGEVKPGYLAAVREFTLAVDCLDEIESPLLVQTEIVHGNEIGLLYAFAMESSGSVLLSGRVSVFLPV